MGGVLHTKASPDVSFVIVKNVLAAKYKVCFDVKIMLQNINSYSCLLYLLTISFALLYTLFPMLWALRNYMRVSLNMKNFSNVWILLNRPKAALIPKD